MEFSRDGEEKNVELTALISIDKVLWIGLCHEKELHVRASKNTVRTLKYEKTLTKT